MDESSLSAEPEVELRQLWAERTGQLHSWSTAWLVKNRGSHRLLIQAVRLPHGQFKAEEKRFDPAIDLGQGEESAFETLVRCDERPGPVTENAFVIFYVIWLDEPWRIFARIRVVVNSDGKPQATIESLTTQRVGFAKENFR